MTFGTVAELLVKLEGFILGTVLLLDKESKDGFLDGLPDNEWPD